MPLRASLRLEAIGDHLPAPVRQTRTWPWVARIYDSGDGRAFAREFVAGRKDYSLGNSLGSRGVYLYYALPPGVYEVNAPRSWRRTERYFIAVNEGRVTRISADEVRRWLASAD